MSFGHPLLLLTVLVVPLAVLIYRLAERRRMRYAISFTNVDVLAQVVRGRQWRRYVPLALFLLALATASVAVARPRVNTLVPTDRATVILVVDDSGSMFADDVRPTRLAAAQQAVRAFLDQVPRQVRVGLIVFAAEPQVATPPTTDHDLVRQSVDAVGTFPVLPGTAIGDALAAAADLGRQAIGGGAPRPNGTTIAYTTPTASKTGAPVAILFLSDGSQTRGLLAPLEGAQRAKAAGIPVYTIALGTPEGMLTRNFGGFRRVIPVPPDPETLRAIAETTGGEFFAARSAKALRAAYGNLGKRLGRVPGRREVTYEFLAGAALLLLAAGGLSALWSPRMP
jgi:Ca-activated chloride channel family protein